MTPSQASVLRVAASTALTWTAIGNRDRADDAWTNFELCLREFTDGRWSGD